MRVLAKAPNYSQNLLVNSIIAGLILALFCLAPTLAAVAAAPAPESNPQIRIGVLAKRGNEQCLQQWGATADYLTRKIPDHSFAIIPLGFDEINMAAETDDVDFILANSSYYVNLEVRARARRIATLNNVQVDGTTHNVFAGTIFCRADRLDIQSEQDLKNKTFMAVDEKSLGGWHAGWRELKEHGIDPHHDFAELRFGGSHDAVVFAVLAGEVDAGTVRSDTIERMALEGKIQLNELKILMQHVGFKNDVRFLHSTAHYPEWPFAQFPHTSDILAKQVAVALMQMPSDSPAAQAGRCAGWTIPQNYRPVHECLMALRLAPYENFGKVPLRGALGKYWPWLLGLLILTAVIFLFIIRASRLQVKLEQSLLAKEERERARDLLQMVLDSLPIGVMTINAETRLIRQVNPAAAEMIGLPPEKITGQVCHRFICPSEKSQCPILDLGQTYYHSEQVLLTEPPGELSILKTVVPIMLEGQQHLLEAFIDISERKRGEAERERLTFAIEQVAEMVIITDTDGVIQYVNPAFERNTGFKPTEALDQNLRLLLGNEPDDDFFQGLWNTITSGKTWSGRTLSKKKDGTYNTQEATISPVLNPTGQTVNYVAVLHDITDEVKIEEKFRQAQKMESVGRLAGGVAHDFNNMLGVILGYTEMALAKIDPAQSLHGDLTEVQAAAERSVEVTRQLLGFARKQTVAPLVLNLNEAVGGMLKMLQQVAGEDIDLAWLPESEVWPVKIDPSQASQILVNLCINARDAIDDVGKITIETRNVTIDDPTGIDQPEVNPGPYVELAVSDNGCGMDKATLNKIFEPFFTSKNIGKGTGLGLSTVYGIVKQNSGFINVYSEAGQGTVFKIYLPRSSDQPLRVAEDKKVEKTHGGQETILLVEDQIALLEMVEKMLVRQGYTVLTASSPGNAISQFGDSAHQIQLLLTDVIMPEMNGWDLMEKLSTYQPGLKRLFMSGHPADVIAHHGVLEVDVPFIQKPFSMEELSGKVREVLDKGLLPD